MSNIPQKGNAPDDRAHEIADHLIGTCQSIHGEVTDEEQDDTVLMSELDELVFECEGCGWWCSTDELNNDGPRQLCDECNSEDHEDETD